MREILIKPGIFKFGTFEEFAKDFQTGEKDLILTTAYLKERYIDPVLPDVRCIVQEDYGVGEPSEEMIVGMFAAADYDAYDRVIAIGGGSIMDIAKLFVIRRPKSVNDLFFHREEIVREKQLVCIPTTCGTGAEVTMTSVANVHTADGGTTKMGLLDEKLIADTAVLIPEFLEDIPLRPMAESLLDALIHATESFLSPSRATMTSDLFAKGAIEIILRALKMYGEGASLQKEYAEEMLTAAMYAGIAFLTAGCGIVHGVSYPLSGKYHVTHGAANYAFFDAALRMYDEHDPDGRMKELRQMIADVLGGDEKDAVRTLAEAEEYLLPVKTLKEYGATESDLDEFTESVFENQMRLVNNAYYPMGKEDVRELYQRVYE